MGGQKRAADVDGDQLVEVLDAELEKRTLDQDTGCIHQNIDMACPSHNIGNRRAHGRFRRHIASNEGLGCLTGRYVEANRVKPVSLEAHEGCTPDAMGGAGDNGDT